jgi:flagellar motility protein MotE (MotC chaperone)
VKKLMAFVSMVCLLNVLAAAGLVGYLVATGRLDKVKGQAVVDLLRHKGTPENFREELYDILEPAAATASAPATGPASRPAVAGGETGPATAEERIDYARRAMEQERLQLEAEAQDLRHRQELLTQVQAQVEEKLKRIDDQKKAFDEAVAKEQGKGSTENFQKSLALYDELKPKQVKELFVGMPVEQAAKYLDAMAPDRAAKIIGEFKSPEDRAFLNKVLEQLRSAGTGAASGSRTAVSQR